MSHHIGKVKKRMVETLLPFQCNHVEGLWKNTQKNNNTKTKREKVETNKRRRRRRKRRNSSRGWSMTSDLCGQPAASSTWCSPCLVVFFFPIYYYFFLTNSLVPDLKKVQSYPVLAKKRTVSLKGGEFKTCFSVFFFFLDSNSKGSRELWEAVWSRFSKPCGWIAVRTVPCFFGMNRFLRLKEPCLWEVHG